MKVTWMLVSLLALSLGSADDEGEDLYLKEKKAGRRRYCGPELRSSLQLLCDSNYNKLKRNSPGISAQEDWRMNFFLMNEPQTGFPFRSRAKALSMIPEYMRRQTRSGVADECCSKSCSVDELLLYCAL